MLYYMRKVNLSTKAMVTIECLLGLHLRQHRVRWRTDGRFIYMMRPVPGGPPTPYSKTLTTYPGRAPGTERERYERLERAVELHRWGEGDLNE